MRLVLLRNRLSKSAGTHDAWPCCLSRAPAAYLEEFRPRWSPTITPLHQGTIEKYIESTGAHVIQYDDGDHEHVQLPDETGVFL